MQTAVVDTRWVDVLKQARYPLNVVVLDFETYFDEEYSLRKMGTIEYIQDERFEVLGLAALHMSANYPFAESQPYFWTDVPSFLTSQQYEFGRNLERCTIVAQNARFDMSILAFRYGISPPHIIDTRGLALHYDTHAKAGLVALCERFGLPPKGETDDFKGYTRQSRWYKPKARKRVNKIPKQRPKMTPEKELALAEYANNDAEQEWAVFTKLLPILSRPDVELRLIQHTLKMFWESRVHIDYDEAEVVVAEMEKRIDDTVEAAGYTREDLSGDKSFAKLLGDALAVHGETIPTKPGKKGPIPALAKDDPPRKALLAHKDPKVRELLTARIELERWRPKIKRVRRIVAHAKANGGVLCVPLNYHGAHTGRWSGAELINLQNLGARGDPLDARVRNILLPPPGCKFVIVDATAIEARVLAWLAGEDGLVEDFRADRDVYCEFASKVIKRRIRKPVDSDPAPVAAIMKKGRNLGKVGILGCGYQMGGPKCRTYAIGYGLTLSEKEAYNLVEAYRAANPAIVMFWKNIQAAFRYTCKYGKPGTLRGLKFRKDGNATIITLPCGRDLWYHEAVVGMKNGREDIKMPDKRKPGAWIRIYGGYLTENVVQAISRDILAEGVLTIEAGGFDVALHCHDETVAIADDGDVAACLALSIRALSTPPEWGLDIPLGAEGAAHDRYCK